MRIKKSGAAIALGVVLAMSLAACASSEPEPADTPIGEPTGGTNLTALIEAAQAEGTVTWYTSLNTEVTQNVADAFSAEYGIEVQRVRAAGPELYPRFQAEEQAGTHTADVLTVVSQDGFMATAIKDGLFTPMSELEIPGVPPEGVDEALYGDPDFPTIAGVVLGICYNTDLVAGKDVPTSWEDLLKPAWKGELAVPNAEDSITSLAIIKFLLDGFGDDYLEDLAGQVKMVYVGQNPQLQAVAAGEAPIAGPAALVTANTLVKEGAPLECVVPDTSTAIEQSVSVSANAPHPDAAKLFAQYLLAEEAAELITANGGIISPWGTGDVEIPSDYVPFAAPSEADKSAS